MRSRRGDPNWSVAAPAVWKFDGDPYEDDWFRLVFDPYLVHLVDPSVGGIEGRSEGRNRLLSIALQLSRHARRRFAPPAVAIARTFHPHGRWFLLRELVEDGSGESQRLTRLCPGAYLLGALLVHEERVPRGRVRAAFAEYFRKTDLPRLLNELCLLARGGDKEVASSQDKPGLERWALLLRGAPAPTNPDDLSTEPLELLAGDVPGEELQARKVIALLAVLNSQPLPRPIHRFILTNSAELLVRILGEPDGGNFFEQLEFRLPRFLKRIPWGRNGLPLYPDETTSLSGVVEALLPEKA